MKKEEIHFGDLRRWLIGYTTPEFMMEVAFRTSLIFLILLLTVRLLGKRMTSQLTITELSVMITLGAIVSPAMQLPDRGLMFGVIGLTVAVLFQRGLNLWAFKNPKVETLTQGSAVLLIKDGTLLLDELRKASITRQQVFAKLRENDIHHLGQVQRLYMEASGIFSLFEGTQSKPGLPVFPSNDPVVADVLEQAPGNAMVCQSCGNVQQIPNAETLCAICREHSWINAYASKSES